ncbi:MAG: radical SAM protein [Bacilli bacterium]|nr:radical SAM protein [Bacilli bacterium]
MKISKYNIEKKYEDKILIYNSFSKASIILEKDSNTDMFKDIDCFNKLPDKEKKILIEQGFVVSDDRDEFSEIKYIYEQKYFDTEFFNIVLVPSLLCNFNCPYCFEKDFDCGKNAIRKYFLVLKKYAERNFKMHKFVQISLFGGEPLLYIGQCLEFLDWVKEDSKRNGYEYFTSIVTNGSLLNKDILDRLLSHNLYSLQITIDSDKENHDKMRIFKDGRPSFDLLITKINELVPLTIKYEKFKFIVRINLNNTDVDKVSNTLKRIKKENRKHIHLLIRAIYNTHAYNETNTNSVSKLLEYFELGDKLGFNVLKEKYYYQTCEACGDRKFFYLMPDLTLRKCINDLGFEESCIGKLDDDGEPHLNSNNIVQWYKNCMSAFIDKECINCKMLPDCLGGCPLYKCKHNKKSCRTFDMSCLPFIF